MVNLTALLRALRDNVIQANPVTVQIERTVFADDGAGGKAASLANPQPAPFVGRIFVVGSDIQRTVSDAGPEEVSSWGLLAPWNADIRHGPDVEDAFTIAQGTFRVRQVVPVYANGEMVAQQVALEEVR